MSWDKKTEQNILPTTSQLFQLKQQKHEIKDTISNRVGSWIREDT